MGLFDIFRNQYSPAPAEARIAESMPRDRDGRTIFLDDVVRYGKSAFDVVAVSHRGRVALRKHGADRGAGAFWAPSRSVSKADGESEAGHAS